MRSLMITISALLALAVACGESPGPPAQRKPSSNRPPTTVTTGATTASVNDRAIVLDDPAISDFYRQVSPSGPIEGPKPGGLRSSLLPDSIQPIYTPKFVRAEQASFLEPEELVMGVDINGEARAYPVGLMRVREMANDTVGGVPILVTW